MLHNNLIVAFLQLILSPFALCTLPSLNAHTYDLRG